MTERRPLQPLRKVFAIPLLMGVLSTIGLIAALVGDDLWDVVSWLTLGITIVVMGWCYFRKRPAKPRAAR